MAQSRRANDIMIDSIRRKVFYRYNLQNRQEVPYEILDLFLDRGEKNPLRAWYFQAKNLQTGEKERIPIVEMYALIEGKKIKNYRDYSCSQLRTHQPFQNLFNFNMVCSSF